MNRVSPPPPGAVALTAFRELPDGRVRQYTESWTPDNPWQGREWFIRMCGAAGYLRDSDDQPCYTALDAITKTATSSPPTTSRTPARSGSYTGKLHPGSLRRTGP